MSAWYFSLIVALLVALKLDANDDFYPDGAYYEAVAMNTEKSKEASPHNFRGYVGFVSDYRIRGISQTLREPAIQGGLTYTYADSFYLGIFGSNVDGTSNYYTNASLEWDFFSGWKHKLCTLFSKDLNYDIGVIYYFYPGGETQRRHPVRFNTLEYYFELSYDWITFRYWQTLSNYFGFGEWCPPFNWHAFRYDKPNGSSKGSIYVETNITVEPCPTWTLQLHLGEQYVRHYHRLNYTDWRATLSKTFDWFTVFVTYVGTNANSHYYSIIDNAFDPNHKSLAAQGLVIGLTRPL